MNGYIEWVNKAEYVFRIKDKEKVAQMWGEKRDRPEEGKKAMTYESLARSLRYYYQHDMMASVNKKLQYKFTEKSLEEWEAMKSKASDAAAQ